MKLSGLYNLIRKYDPDLLNPEIEEYCLMADEIQREEKYNFGYMSLKWGMYQIEAIAPERVKYVFKAILIEHLARQKSIDDLQFRILKYAAVGEYNPKIRENTRDRIDLADLDHFEAGNFNIVINETGHNLTSRIMRDTNADAILFIEPDLKKAGIQFRVNSSMNKLDKFKEYFFQNANLNEDGWSFVGQEKNLIINHGLQNKTPSTLTIEYLKSLILKYFKL